VETAQSPSSERKELGIINSEELPKSLQNSMRHILQRKETYDQLSAGSTFISKHNSQSKTEDEVQRSAEQTLLPPIEKQTLDNPLVKSPAVETCQCAISSRIKDPTLVKQGKAKPTDLTFFMPLQGQDWTVETKKKQTFPLPANDKHLPERKSKTKCDLLRFLNN